jgi:hypothetical protein
MGEQGHATNVAQVGAHQIGAQPRGINSNDHGKACELM